MQFVNYIREQSAKLKCREYVLHLWEELKDENHDGEVSSDAINEFNNHLPVLLEQFWEIALEKAIASETLEEIDEEIKIYTLVLIYQCITQSHESVSFKCVLHSCEVYLHLLANSQQDEFYKSKLYLTVLTTLQSSLETGISDEKLSQLVYVWRKFLTKSKLKVPDLEVTLATLVQIVFVKTREVVKNFGGSKQPGSVSFEGLFTLKTLLERELMPSKQFIITLYLFNGLKKHDSMRVAPRHFSAIQNSFRNLIKDLHAKFKEDSYKTFMNAFIHVWKHSDFTFYGEAVLIMNNLKEKHYRKLLDCLTKMMLSKGSHKNLFKLALSIICFPPKYISNEKIKVTNEILVKYLLLNCMSSKSELSNCALESLAELIMSPDLEKEYIKDPIKNVLNCKNDQNMSVPILLKGLQSLATRKWGVRSKNKHIFVMVISIMLFSEEDHLENYREVLDFLTDQCSPFDLKHFTPFLSETYLGLTSKNFKHSALLILKLIFKMALHPMASSTEFVKYLYMAMIYPNVCKGITVKAELFIDPIITDDFNFSEFFQKCHTLGLIKNEHVSKLIGNISSTSESNLRLLCAIVHLTDYKELSIVADHVNDNFMTICNSSKLNYFLYIYNKLCKNSASVRSPQNVRSNEVMVCFLKYHLLRLTLRWNCVANAFTLLKTLHEYTNLDEDFASFKEQYDLAVSATLQAKGNFLPLLYYSQLVVFGRVLPSEPNLEAMINFLTLCSDQVHNRSPEFNPKIWIGCLLLYANICVVKTNLVEAGLDYLQNGLNSSVTAVKLAAINLTFDLCNMVTHNFEDLIRYMFKQLVYGDNVFKKTCLLKIDRLIRDDYLKLDLEQFLIFVTILADRNVSLSDYLKQLLSENFFISNGTMITRYFLPLIIHINGYRKHPNYKISNSGYERIQFVSRNILDRRKMYNLLFVSLPIKNRFTIIHMLSTQILEFMMKGTALKVDDGFWKMVKDCIYIFKLIGWNTNEEDSCLNFYKKVINLISKHLLHKAEYADKSLHMEYHKEIIHATETLLKLLFHNDSHNVLKFIGISLFDAIIYWTNFLIGDLIHIVHEERNKEILNYFVKLDKFYKDNSHSLRYTEESFENARNNDDLAAPCSGLLFNSTEGYVPEFDK